MDVRPLEKQTSRHTRIAVSTGAEPADWQTIYDRLESRATPLAVVLANASAVTATLAGLFCTMGLLSLGIWQMYPQISPYVLACFVVPPGFLVGAAAGQGGGNLFFRLWFWLDDSTRRGFATRLTLARAPDTWPGMVRRWLFTGDWLSTPTYDMRLPYLRIFVIGDAPATCREEDAIWREIHGSISCDGLWEAGRNHREISYPRDLPGWAKRVGKGDGFDELKRLVGHRVAAEWVEHLWRRAWRQWPSLGAEAFPENARRDCFEMHLVSITGGRDALLVVLRPLNLPAEAVSSRTETAEAYAA